MKLSANQFNNLVILSPSDLSEENKRELSQLELSCSHKERIEEQHEWHTLVFYKDKKQIGAVLFDELNNIISVT